MCVTTLRREKGVLPFYISRTRFLFFTEVGMGLSENETDGKCGLFPLTRTTACFLYPTFHIVKSETR